ncbi:glycosyltransferase [Nocardioides sp. YIM 152588]|uniref:glycosyltransferase n=1 Tax=Nocardioides sp. YIM 152588 TaxID=3158259 RepID=UPI0032E4482D
MSRRVSVALPVYNGGVAIADTIRSVLAQTHTDIELVISDNASTDDTEEICRDLAGQDSRIVYRRHRDNIGLLNNFRSAAEATSGSFVRWIGDDDVLDPRYVELSLTAFAEDPRRVLVTTQVTYVDQDGREILDASYDPSPLRSPDPVERFAAMLRLLTSGFAVVDPLYGLMRREAAVVDRRNILLEDEIFAARLALAGSWAHVASPLARRRRDTRRTGSVAAVLGVPRWQGYCRHIIQCRELAVWIDRSDLEPHQRTRARAEVARLYGRRKTSAVMRARGRIARAIETSMPVSEASAR